MMMSLHELALACNAKLVGGNGNAHCVRIETDSRAVEVGDVFIALQGERFDAHDFLPNAAQQGAIAAVVTRVPDGVTLPCLVVADTRLALGQIAAAWRKRFAIQVVAVTGSNGKTTVKEMLASIFALAVGAMQRLSTSGNFNNDIGLPLTVLKLNDAHQLAVIELGMNHPGETAYLAQIAQPTVALINNAQREHQEFMVSVAAVAQEHSAVLAALPNNGVAVYPAHTPYSEQWRAVAGSRRIYDFDLSCGKDEAAVHATWQATPAGAAIVMNTPAGAVSFVLPLLGEHNVMNALAASAAALGAGVSLDHIAQALSQFKAVKGRLQIKANAKGDMVIDDTYNANPDSVRAAIDVLAAQGQHQILVLGDMGEVGDQGPAFHKEVGTYAKQRGITQLFTLGDLAQYSAQAFGQGAQAFTQFEELLPVVQSATQAGGITVLVKGSRFMKMERVVEALAEGAKSHA